MSSYFERYEVVWPDSDTDDCCGMGLRLDPDHIPKDVRAKDAARFMSLNTSQNFKGNDYSIEANGMNFDIGYHVISQETLNENDGNAFNTQMSIVEFLRRVKYMDDIPYDVTVYGLDELLRSVDDPEMMSQYIHDVLAERVNFLLNKNPIVQFVVDNIELWDEPVIPDDNDDIPLGQIFNYSLEQEGAGWYYARLNVTS